MLTFLTSLKELMINLYILDSSPLLDVGLVKIFSQSVGCHFVLLTMSSVLQKLCFLFVFVCLFVLFVFLVFRDRVSLYSPGCPGTHFVDQSGIELRNPPASASQVLGSKACATTPGCLFVCLFP